MKHWALFFLILLPISVFAAEEQATAILLDNSKSIKPQDFQKSKELIQQIQEEFPGQKLLYVFGNEMRKIDQSELMSLQATESYTMIYDAAYDAAQELSAIDAERKAIIIISDGLDTKSATVLEDIVSFANSNGIAVFGVGVSNPNRKVLERMARLTGGKYFPIDSADTINQMQSTLLAQKKPPKKQEPSVVTSQPPPAPSQVPTPRPAESAPVQSEPVSRIPWKWVLLLLLGAVVMGAVIFLVARSYRTEPRVCPTCGRTLEAYQTICPVCSVSETRQTKQITLPPSPDGTQEIDNERDDAIPMELLEKKQVTEEMLSKTFVLMETPMLVVRKGKNLGQTFSLNRAFPVSIGRSRVNEIRLDDITISGQHCRIIPENGKHVLYDLNSTNGTFLNDKKVTRSALKEGDTIRVGETQFLYKIEQHRT